MQVLFITCVSLFTIYRLGKNTNENETKKTKIVLANDKITSCKRETENQTR